MAEITFPDRNKNPLTIPQLSDAQLEYWTTRVQGELTADPDGKWSAANRRKLDALAAERERRAAGGTNYQPQAPAPAPAPQASSAALARAPATSTAIAGSHASTDAVGSALLEADRKYHLVSPATQCGSLPEGCEVVIALVHVDGRIDRGKPMSSDIYPVGGGKFGLGKAPLDRIAGAAGVDWDPVLTRRLDDGRDPHYCMFQAVGTVRSFDGTRRTITGTKEMDLRDGSPQCEALAARKRDGSGDASTQIREMRLHILGHAETKAKLRAIRSLGIQTSYQSEELERPFAVARLMFTGRTQDPALRREFARMTAEAMIGGTRALYGATAAPALPPPVSAPAAPAGSLDDDDYVPEPPRQITTAGERMPSEPRNAAPAATPAADWDRGPNPDDY
jgi:hypothetical protein